MTSAIDRKNEKSQLPAHDFDGLAKVSSAQACLAGARDQAAGLESIREVAANILGSEQLAVFKVAPEKAALWLYWCVGIDPNEYGYLDVMHERELERVLAGEIIFADDNSDKKLLSVQDAVTALIPIFVDSVVAAVLVIFRLLPQRSAFDAADREVCRLLSTSASRAVQPPAREDRLIERSQNK
jgi:hypothetical protein